MRVIAGGVDLGVIETHYLVQEAVYDDAGVDYLYTRVAGKVRVQVSGQALVTFGVGDGTPGGGIPGRFQNGPFLSYAYAEPQTQEGRRPPTVRPNPGGPVVGLPLGVEPAGTGVGSAAPGGALRRIVRVTNAPALTLATVRQRLLSPRLKLWVFAGLGSEAGSHDLIGNDTPGDLSQLILEAPVGTAPCDAKNGPFGKSFTPVAAVGDANLIVGDYEFEAFVNEAVANNVRGYSALLSNRFSQVQIVDEAGYTTAITGGTAVFRTDLLYQLLQSPDDSRPLLFMPIPPGCVRENIQVEGRADVTGVTYSYRDRQVPVNFPAGPYARAASIQAYHRQAINSGGDIFGGVLDAYERVWGIKAQRNFAKQSPTHPTPAPGTTGSSIQVPLAPPKHP